MGLDFEIFDKSNKFGDGLSTIQSVYGVGLELGLHRDIPVTHCRVGMYCLLLIKFFKTLNR